jgi:integrase
MVVNVRLSGLKIARARGKYYVYRRADGIALLKGFEGDKAALLRRLAEPDMIAMYNVGRRRRTQAHPERSLGWLVAWFVDPEQCPECKDLSETTRDEYKDRLNYLEPEFDAPLEIITQASLYEVRDRCVKDKWPAFADKLISALSSMFTAAVKRGYMATNPARGIERASKPNPNANREWRPEEWVTIFERARPKFRIAMMIARHLGYRSQSIVRVQWSHYQPDPTFGKCFRMTHKKNTEQHWVPAVQELQDFLEGLPRTSTHIATRHNGPAWTSPEQLQKQFSNFINGLEKAGLVGPGLTLHGLRVTFAAARKRQQGANNEQVAAALGDRDTRMGAHYTRHVENELKVIRAFGKPKRRRGIK